DPIPGVLRAARAAQAHRRQPRAVGPGGVAPGRAAGGRSMRCRQARETILAVVRGRATEAERLRLEEHLAGCEPCRVERGQWARAGGRGREPVAVEAPLVTEEKVLREERPGVVALPGARVWYRERTSLRVAPGRGELELYQGEVEVDVTPGGPGRFRVVTPRF